MWQNKHQTVERGPKPKPNVADETQHWEEKPRSQDTPENTHSEYIFICRFECVCVCVYRNSALTKTAAHNTPTQTSAPQSTNKSITHRRRRLSATAGCSDCLCSAVLCARELRRHVGPCRRSKSPDYSGVHSPCKELCGDKTHDKEALEMLMRRQNYQPTRCTVACRAKDLMLLMRRL